MPVASPHPHGLTTSVPRILMVTLLVLLALVHGACGPSSQAATNDSGLIEARPTSSRMGAEEVTASGAPRPAPEWVAHAFTRDDLLLHLNKHATYQERKNADVDTQMLDALDRMLLTFTLDDERPLRARGQLVRSLANGLLFDSQIDLEIRAIQFNSLGEKRPQDQDSPLEADLFLRIQSKHGEPVAYHGRLAQHGLHALDSSDDELPFGFEGQEIHRNLPVSLGDLPLADLLGLRAALLDGNIDDLGELAVGRSERLRVVEISFPDWLLRDEGPAEKDYTTRGASALLYLDIELFLPKALRVLDRAGRLVRVYDNLIYAAPAGAIEADEALSLRDPQALRLVGLQVHNAAQGGHSTFRFDPVTSKLASRRDHS